MCHLVASFRMGPLNNIRGFHLVEGARILSFLFLTFWVNGPKRNISSSKGQFLLQSHKTLGIDSYHQHSSIGGGWVRVMLVGYPVLALMWFTVFFWESRVRLKVFRDWHKTLWTLWSKKMAALLLTYKPVPKAWSLLRCAVSCPELCLGVAHQQHWADGSFDLNI